MKGAAQFFLDTLVTAPDARLTWSPTRRTRRSCPTTRTPACAPVRPWTTRSCGTCSTAAHGPARSSAWTPPSAPRYGPPGTGWRRCGSAPAATSRSGSPTGWSPSATTGTSPTCTACTPATRSPSGARPSCAEAARRTLELRGDDGTGWSLAWKINFWARLEDGARAHKLVRDLVTNGPARAEHVRPAPAVPDRRQLRRHLRHRRDAAAEPQRRAAPAARAAVRLADRERHGSARSGRIHGRHHVEREPGATSSLSRPTATAPSSCAPGCSPANFTVVDTTDGTTPTDHPARVRR